ncbi:Dos2-interacting transcription regulator of RNA-Pol-II-domain-containing protein [Xylariales sp. PMI_506]|nr:Dos2-interacting transcription regulator of RNA-Pol-II-domain-containing protein [Xylariales sp. PMI_506]
MASPFKDLAVKFVLADSDDESALANIAQNAVAEIEKATTTRAAIGQWVSSINQWMPGGKEDEGEDDDIIARAKALGFLAQTLQLLPKDLLKQDQVKLLIGFFNSLFSSDHKAGITASAKALNQLVSMKNFQISSGNDIITGIVKLGDDFKRQTPATRLEIYKLLHSLFSDSLVANDLSYQHGDTCGFMTSLVEMCRSERDPQNLIKWFEIQALFLGNFAQAEAVTEDVFKSFSAYFPITLRASATPSGITVDDLKGAVRSCFAAHHRLAKMAIPFLIGKLDQGEAVTVSVKVDILQTLDSCLAKYENAKQNVFPYADQIWSSLKYEVRNGEIQDTVAATLKTISTLAKRLDAEDLQQFFSTAWSDLSEDLSNTNYTSQAGQLLTAIAGASHEAFSLAMKTSIPHIEQNLKQTKPNSLQSELLSLLNAVLLVRSALIDSQDGSGYLQDSLFGDNLFNGIYARIWSEWTQSQTSPDRPGIMSKLIDGMSYLVIQKSSDGQRTMLCSNTVCSRIFSSLGSPAVIYPLEGRRFLQGSNETEQEELSSAAGRALARVAPLYPIGYQQLISQFLGSTTIIAEKYAPSASQAEALREAGSRLAIIGCSAIVESTSPLLNFVSLINTLLVGLDRVLRASVLYWTPVIDAIHISILQSFASLTAKLTEKHLDQLSLSSTDIKSHEWYDQFHLQVAGIPQIDKADIGSLEKTSEALGNLQSDEVSAYIQFKGYALFVVAQIYRRVVSVKQNPNGSSRSYTKELGPDFSNLPADKHQDQFLYQLGRMATSVIRTFSEEEQKSLLLLEDVFLMFHGETKELRSEIYSSLFDVHDEPSTGLIRDSAQFRTAPLAMGIMQALWPNVLSDVYTQGSFLKIVSILMQHEEIICENARPALDIILATLSNRITGTSISKQQQKDLSSGVASELRTGFSMIDCRSEAASRPDVPTLLAVFRSLMHFFAGYITNYHQSDDIKNLLMEIYAVAPRHPILGRSFSQYFEILVSPKECLEKENHAIVKRLKGQWIYNQLLKPNLQNCFVQLSDTTQLAEAEQVSTNYSVVVFAMLKHLDWSVWADDAAQILRIVIKSLTAFGTSKDINVALSVLVQILTQEPKLLKSHITTLITNILAVYEMASNVATPPKSIADPHKGTMSRKDAALCRKSCLQFVGRLAEPGLYDESSLRPHRHVVLRGLSQACGDRAREVRQIAIVSRQAWTLVAP